MPQQHEITTREATWERGAVLRRASSLNEADRSVEVCWSTGAAVKRYSWDEGYYMEELAVDKKSIRLDRFDSMSLLDAHENKSMAHRLGTVVPGSVRIEGGKAYARIKFSKKPLADEIFQDLRDDHPVAISVGYKIHQYEKTEAENGQLPKLRAIDWEPMELSAVPIPADAGAFSRSAEETYMPEHVEQQQRPAPTNIINERRRVSDIRAFARVANLDDEILDRAIEDGTTLVAFRDQALETIVARQNRSPAFPHADHSENRYGGMTRGEAIADALQYRTNPRHKPNDASREFVNLSLMETARAALEGAGVSTSGMARSDIASRALHTTSDFPLALAKYGHAKLQEGYAEFPSGLKAVAKRTTISDFRPKHSIRLSDFPSLKKVNEHGEFTRGTIYESEESYKLETQGAIVGMTRQMLVNDDLDGFGKPAAAFGKRAAEREAEILLELLLSNPKMKSDNTPLFHASHKNLGTAAALSIDALAVARIQMRKQVDERGRMIGAIPRYLVVGPDLEMQAERYLATVHPTQNSQVNPLSGKIEIVVENRLVRSPTEYFLVADPYSIEGLEYAYLAGEEGPQFDERVGFDVDGVEYKVRLDFGAGFLDWRGWYHNAGA